jgi:hypothetical protein
MGAGAGGGAELQAASTTHAKRIQDDTHERPKTGTTDIAADPFYDLDRMALNDDESDLCAGQHRRHAGDRRHDRPLCEPRNAFR